MSIIGRVAAITELRTALIVLWSLVVPFAAASPLTDADLTERLQACAACHGERGQSRNDTYYPSIAGKPYGYLYFQLENFRDGRREHAIMRGMLEFLSDSYLKEIASYYSRQHAVWAAPAVSASEAELERGRELVERGDPELGVPACTSCHGRSLRGIDPWIPGLLGLRQEYLSAQLGGFRSGARRGKQPDCMATIAGRLRSSDIRAATVWIASKELRADEPHWDAVPPEAELPLPCGSVQ